MLWGSRRVREDPGILREGLCAVDSIRDICSKVGAYGRKVLRSVYTEDEKQYAALEDPEGNPFLDWQTPGDLTFRAPESQTYYKWDRAHPHKLSLFWPKKYF